MRRPVAVTVLFVLLASVFVGGITGCSRRTVTTTETVDVEDRSTARGDYRREEVRTVEKDSGSDGCSGVLSCGVDVVGDVIAFPFKAIGALVGAIF